MHVLRMNRGGVLRGRPSSGNLKSLTAKDNLALLEQVVQKLGCKFSVARGLAAFGIRPCDGCWFEEK